MNDETGQPGAAARDGRDAAKGAAPGPADGSQGAAAQAAEPSPQEAPPPGAALGHGLMQRYVAHEFRSQLSVVVGAARLLSRNFAPPAAHARSLCAALDESATLLIRMLDDWQAATGAGPARFSLKCRWLDLRPWLEQWLANHAATGAPVLASGARVPMLLFRAAADARVMVDPQRLGQCLTNLLSNAYKYGGSPAAVRLEVHQAEGELLLVVADAGPGLQAEQVEQLFKPFVRLEPDSTRPGQGLGLSLTRILVEAMGGRIGVQSTAGEGTRFTIALQSA